MTITPLTLIAFTTAGLAAIVAVYMAKKSSANYTLLIESAGTFTSMQNEIKRLAGLVSSLSQENKTLLAESTAARAQADEARRNFAAAAEKMALSETAANQARDHLQRDRAQFIRQIEAANAEIDQLKSVAARVTRDEKLVAELESAHGENSRLRESLKKAQSEFSVLNQARVTNEEELARLKRRNAQLERLYQSMRSLKVMAEERNANWEHALKDLSCWTLSQNGRLPPDGKTQLPIGELVGGALETIGKELVEVEIEA